jgi:L-arabinokinase
MVQNGPMQVDPAATAQAYHDFLEYQPTLIEHEVAFIHAEQIALVVADMPPIACEIADVAGVPSVVMTHFSWDWVYGHYVERIPAFAPIIESIESSYGKATLALQMQIPIPHPFTAFPRVEPIPGVAKIPTRTIAQIRAEFGVPDEMKLAVLSMGGHDWGKTDVRALQQIEGWRFLVMPGAYAQVQGDPRFILIPQEYPNFHNLIAAADVLIGKAGGSTVAEIIAHRTPMIYAVNDDWRENELMIPTLQQYAHSLFLDKSDFERGAWAAHLDSFVAQPFVWPDMPMNGAQVAADLLMGMI